MAGKCRFRSVKFLSGLAACLLLSAIVSAGEKKNKPAEKTFHEKIDAAIKKGVDYLLSMQNKDGSFLPFPGDKAAEFPIGHTALVTLALLKCGVSPRDKAIVKAFGYLSKLECNKTYSAVLYLMALEAKYYNRKKFKEHIEKKTKGFSTTPEEASASFKPKIHPADRKLGQYLADWLVSAQLPNGAWTYGKLTLSGPGNSGQPIRYPYDNSNTQYALLGLKAASRLGAKIPADAFIKNLAHFLDTQEKDGPKVPGFTIPAAHLDSFEYKKSKKKKKKKKYGTSADYDELYGRERDEFKARGWCYSIENGTMLWLSGTMTAGGIGCVIICKSELLKYKIFRKKFKQKTNEAIEDGCAWFFRRFNEKGLEGWPEYHQYFYYLYGLERVGALSGLRTFGKFDWYREGANQILGLQKPDGHWEYDRAGKMKQFPDLKFYPQDLVDTSFAVLFLKRSTVGVIEGDLIYTGKGFLDKKSGEEKQEKEEKNKSEK